LILAIVAAFLANEYLAMAVVIAGIAVGLMCVADSEQLLFLVLAVALAAVASSIDVIPVVGPYVTTILASVSALINAAAAAVIVKIVVVKAIP
jgi:hypothetical protein